MESAIYHSRFFDQLYDSCWRSARVVVPEVMRMVRPRSVVDVGCGVGAWLAAFMESGVDDVVGVDGPWVTDSMLRIPADRFLRHNLIRPLVLNRQFDLVLSLEVAEHLPESSAETFVDTLVALGPVILFSAAVPGQGGDGHLNEQPHEWWDNKFMAHAFQPQRGFGTGFQDNPQVAWWYSRNIVVYLKSGISLPGE